MSVAGVPRCCKTILVTALGRTRIFSVEQALAAALAVFWRKGYEGTSYADLVAATGIERPSLCAAFGNKQALFLRALTRHGEHHAGYVSKALDKATSREVAEAVLFGAVELSTRHQDRRGCFGLNGGLAGSDQAEPARRALVQWRADGEAALRQRFERAQSEGTCRPKPIARPLLPMCLPSRTAWPSRRRPDFRGRPCWPWRNKGSRDGRESRMARRSKATCVNAPRRAAGGPCCPHGHSMKFNSVANATPGKEGFQARRPRGAWPVGIARFNAHFSGGESRRSTGIKSSGPWSPGHCFSVC
ncbi:TetR/AcrR family transcriptional regulator [Sulfitobacter sp. LCG007]